MTINQLANEFMSNYAERRLRPSTVRGYAVNLYRHALPVIGELLLDELDVFHLDDLTDALSDRGLSNRSIVYVHATVRKMLNYAIRRRYLSFNLYDRFDLPRVKRYRYKVLSEDEICRLLLLCRGTSIHIPVTLALCYGLRRGECLGIIPSRDLDYANSTLHIQRTRSIERGRDVVTPCKTDDSDRFILLRPEHLALFSATNSDYACPLTPSKLEYRFKRLLQEYDFPEIRFHDLRHSYATLLYKKGVDLKLISDVLGHADLRITADTYCHPDVNVQKRILEVFKV